ncbi:MAG: hypothetical protein HRU03_09335 [Nanoarchaeales archaeon]|nr:hypothetical protein [Nanoarchaeales archaeon]
MKQLNKLRQNKKAMEVQTFFYIFMSIIMIAIIVFGLGQVMSLSDQMSESERVQVQKELIKKFESCEDPLNRGNIEYIELRNQKFNSICFLGSDLDSSYNLSSLEIYDELKIIGNVSDNVVLMQAVVDKLPDGRLLISENQIITSFKIDVDIGTSFCNFPKKNSNDFTFELKCE